MESETITDRKRLDRFHAEAIKFVIDKGNFDLAVALGRARLARIEVNEWPEGNTRLLEPHIYLTADAQDRPSLEAEARVEIDQQDPNPMAYIPGLLVQAFSDLADPSALWAEIHIGAPDPEVGRHQGTAREPGKYEYQGIRYRSRTEIHIAKALDEANVLYFPLPLGMRHYRRLAEPDFLIVHLGRIGILEIDGPSHTPLTRAQESAKDAKLLQSGVRYIHHASVADVDRDPIAVVQNFLAMLRGPIL